MSHLKREGWANIFCAHLWIHSILEPFAKLLQCHGAALFLQSVTLVSVNFTSCLSIKLRQRSHGKDIVQSVSACEAYMPKSSTNPGEPHLQNFAAHLCQARMRFPSLYYLTSLICRSSVPIGTRICLPHFRWRLKDGSLSSPLKALQLSTYRRDKNFSIIEACQCRPVSISKDRASKTNTLKQSSYFAQSKVP